MATHSSILAWRIPWTEEPGGAVQGVAKELGLLEQLSTRTGNLEGNTQNTQHLCI